MQICTSEEAIKLIQEEVIDFLSLIAIRMFEAGQCFSDEFTEVFAQRERARNRQNELLVAQTLSVKPIYVMLDVNNMITITK
jgi:hypothetical protein